MMTSLTLFAAPKPFTQPHIATIQHNAIRTWKALSTPAFPVQVILIGDEPGIAEAAAEHGVLHLPQVQRSSYGTPLISDIFALARAHSDSAILGYINADILLLPDVAETVRQVAAQAEKFLVVGRRWDVDITTPLQEAPGWQDALKADILQRGTLSFPNAIDYFFFAREQYADIPAFALGRSGWDNWMIFKARRSGWQVVDVTPSVVVGHQNHDYSHLPGGQPHHRLPESKDNVRLAGGRRRIFDINDASRRWVEGRPQPVPRTWERFWREVEIFPLVQWNCTPLALLTFALIRPRRAWYEGRLYLSNLKRKLTQPG